VKHEPLWRKSAAQGSVTLQRPTPARALARPGWCSGCRLRENAACGVQPGAPLMTGALMSARYDMEAAEPNVGQLRNRVELLRVSPDPAEVQPGSDAGLRPTGWVA